MTATTTELTGTIVDGRVEFDAPTALPTGTRGRFVPEVEEEDFGPPMPAEPYDREKELAILRESYADAIAGRTRPLTEVMDEIRVKHGLPPRRED